MEEEWYKRREKSIWKGVGIYFGIIIGLPVLLFLIFLSLALF